jgi:hypothetical protein
MEESEEQKRINAEVQRQVNEALQEYAKILSNASAGITGLTTSVKGSTTANTQQAASAGKSAAMQEAAAKATADYNKAMGNLSAATQSAVTGAKQFGSALLSTEEGFGKFGKALESAGDAAWNLGKMIGGPLGIAVGALVKGATMAADAALKQADNVLKATDTVSKLGAMNSFSAEQIRKMGAGAGLTSAELEKMTKPMASMSGGLTLLGGTSAQGVKAFGEMIAVTKETRMEFQRLGLNDAERIQAQADYVGMLERSGGALVGQQKSAEALRKSSLDYTQNLYELSAISGKSIEESKKQMEVARSTVEWQLQQNKWAREYQEAQKTGDKATMDRITAEKAAADKLINDVSKLGDPAKVAAVQQQYLTGAITKTSSQFAVLGVDVDAQIKAAKEGTYQSGQFNDAFKKGAQGMMDGNQSAMALSETFRKATGMNQESISYLNKRIDVESEVTEAAKARAAIDKNAAGKGPAAEDPAQIARNALTEAERAAKLGLDELLASVNPLLNGFNATTTAATALTAAAVLAAGALSAMALKSKMGDLLGKDGPGFEKGAKGASKAGGAMKALGVAGNVLGKLALPLAAGMALYDGAKGYNNAEGNLGIQGRQATTGEKLSSAAGGALSGLTFGLISPETLSKGIAKATGAGPDGKPDGKTLDETKKDNETKAKLQVEQTKVTTTLDSTSKDLNKVMLATKISIDALKVAIEDLTSVASIKDATGTAESKQKKLEDIYKRLGIGAEGPSGTAPSPSGGAAPSPSGGAAPSPGGNIQSSEAQLREAGLVLKKGDVQKAGADLDPRLIDIAKQVQASVPGFMQFTGFNDQFHAEKAPRSLHAKGKAFDFVVSKKPTKEEGAKIVQLMKSLGVDYGIDEYNNPSAQATGGHFHGQLKAYDGGVFEGPKAGYDVELHGREAVVPLPNPDSMITVSDNAGAEKSPLNTAMSASMASNGSSESSEMMSVFMEDFKQFMSMKIDELKDVMEEGNGISDKILTYSKV